MDPTTKPIPYMADGGIFPRLKRKKYFLFFCLDCRLQLALVNHEVRRSKETGYKGIKTIIQLEGNYIE